MDEADNKNKVINSSGSRLDLKDPGTGVKFEDSGWAPHYRAPVVPKMIQWTMKFSGGLVRDEEQAQYVLLAFAVVAAVVSLYLFFGALGGGKEVKFSPQVKEKMQRSAKSPLKH